MQFGEGCGNRGPGNAGLCNSDLYRVVSQSVSGRVPGSASLTCLRAGGEEALVEADKTQQTTVIQ